MVKTGNWDSFKSDGFTVAEEDIRTHSPVSKLFSDERKRLDLLRLVKISVCDIVMSCHEVSSINVSKVICRSGGREGRT